MSRQTYLLGAGLALVALAIAATHGLLAPWPGVTEANCRRIRPGMRRADVDALLGSRPQTIILSGLRVLGKRVDAEGRPYHYAALWSDVELDVIVYFDRRGSVVSHECNHSP